MNILDYFILVIALFLILIAMKNIIDEKGNCAYCKYKGQCKGYKKKQRKNYTEGHECTEK